jgi:hypothetical protein
MNRKMATYLKIGPLLALLGLLAVVLMPSGPASAGSQTWSTVLSPAKITATVAGVVISNDGTIFIWGDADADAVADDIYFSTNGGTTFTTILASVGPAAWNGTAITEIVPSPKFGSDSEIFLAAGTTVYRSSARGVVSTWAANGSGVAAGTITDLAVAGNFNNAGSIAVSFRGIVVAGSIQTSVCTSATCPAWVSIDTTGGAIEAQDGAIAVDFSPNYLSDGRLFAVLTDDDGTDTCPAVGICEARSVSGLTFGVPVAISAVATNAPSRAFIAFPDDYSVAAVDNYLVAANGAGQSVYRRAAGIWSDTTPIGVAATPASGLAVTGNFASATVVAGITAASAAPLQAQITKSTNGGSSWAPVINVGGTTGTVVVALTPTFSSDNTVYTGTTGLQGGLWKSTTGGGNSLAWTSKGLFADTYATILGIDGDPADHSPLFMIFAAAGAADNALFRSTSAGSTSRWEKTGHIAGADVVAVGVSGEFASDDTVYIAAGAQLAKSSNGGQSFATAFVNAIPSGTVNSGHGLEVVSASSVFVAAGSKVHRTSDSGASWATTSISGAPTITDMEASPDFANDNTMIVIARTPAGAAQAFLSTDGGVTFTQAGANVDSSTAVGQGSLAFDSNYATSKTIYAGTDTDVYRWTEGTSTSWLRMRAGANNAGAAPTMSRGAAITDLASADGTLYVAVGPAAGGDVLRVLNPTGTFGGSSASEWFGLEFVGLSAVGASQSGSGRMDQGAAMAAATIALNGAGLLADPSGGNTVLLVDTVVAPDGVYVYSDKVLPAPVPIAPGDASSRGSAPTLQWNPYTALAGAAFMVRLSTDETFTNTVVTSYNAVNAGTFVLATGALVPSFASGNVYYWQVRSADGGRNLQSPWSSVQSYIASAGTPSLQYPTSAPGLRLQVPSLLPGLSWTAVSRAVDYRVQIALDPSIVSAGGSYVNPIITKTVGSATPALQLATGDLSGGSVYYWQVQAIFAGDTSGSYATLSAQAGASGVFQTPEVSGSTSVTPAAGLTAVGTNLERLWHYDNATQAWTFYDPRTEFAAANTVTELVNGTIYWIKVDATVLVIINGKQVTLFAGWNQVVW